MTKVVVVGAGVTGLTTAYLLSEAGHDVTIISKKFHFDGHGDSTYTSNFAGANWSSFADKTQVRLQNYDKPGYRKFLQLARTNSSRSGVLLQTNMVKVTKEVYEADGKKPYDDYFPWFNTFVEEFKLIPGKVLGEEYEFGYSYLGVVISVSTYLGYLLNKCIDNGTTYKRKSIDHILDAFQYHHLSDASPTLVVNCTGLASLNLGGVEDKNMYPIRGQTIIIENDYPYLCSVRSLERATTGESLYLMPRLEGGCLLGGCFIPDDWNAEPDLAMAERMIKRALKHCPELVDPNYKNNPDHIKVVRHQVGLRPARKGYMRVERDPRFKNVIHNYGAGGTGFQSSYGTCAEVVQIVNQITQAAHL